MLTAVASFRGPTTVELLGELATQDRDEITQTLYIPTDVLHMMSHADEDGVASGKQTLWKVFSLEERYYPENLVDFIDEYEEYPEVECLLFDACDSASTAWLTKLRRVVPAGETMTLLGTARSVEIDETLVYTMAFYQCLVSQSRCSTRAARMKQYREAHKFASNTFKSVYQSKSPFILRTISGA